MQRELTDEVVVVVGVEPVSAVVVKSLPWTLTYAQTPLAALPQLSLG